MYESKAFWGLENNSNACTMNTTMNSLNAVGLLPVVVGIVIVIAFVLMMCCCRGFG